MSKSRMTPARQARDWPAAGESAAPRATIIRSFVLPQIWQSWYLELHMMMHARSRAAHIFAGQVLVVDCCLLSSVCSIMQFIICTLLLCNTLTRWQRSQ